jgi:hypothetical protein
MVENLLLNQLDQNYVGSYWKTSSGQFFSKKNPQDIPYEELIEYYTIPNSLKIKFLLQY